MHLPRWFGFASTVTCQGLLLLICLSASAWATHGGPKTLEVLGMDGEQTVYLLEHDEGGAGLPARLLFYRFKASGTQPQVASSWPTEWTASAARLKTLKARLKPLKTAPKSAWSVKTTVRGKALCPQSDWDEERPCHVLDVRFTAAKQTRARRLYAWPGARSIRSAWSMPDGGVLFIYRYVGVTMESGYVRDDAVRVHPTPASTIAQPWTQACSASECSVKVGTRYVIKTDRGRMQCVAKDGWLGCAYAQIDGPYNRAWFVRLTDGEATEIGAKPGIDLKGEGENQRSYLAAPKWDGEYLVWRGVRALRPPR